ncbi:TRAP transporter substrate-binding protein DctP [Vibrio mediterranei]|uniref:TRAP transporter substrate-binding protein DctP n=1 Tax=Vibrio mediterranei TaxID=689 RepID=UPI00184AD6F5|nr:TRAP transporter substrate-binding protein DctP [Vibrio mediterranei]MCG9789876.1 TRAP transporter substrate-binding protein DctP [Vibrio mediterranei]NUW75757.1 TRAP transporter substrate-binding protein DctP [Vibrio mediterranei]
MKFKNLATVIMSTLLLISAPSVIAKTFKLASNVPADSATGKLLQEFAQNVTKETDKRVKIKVFANGTLGGQAQYLQQIQSGVVDMGLVNSAMMENIEPKFGVLNLPFIFRSFDEFKQVMNSDLVQKDLFQTTNSKGFEVVGFMDTGPRSIYSTKPVESVEDIKGLKLRSMASPTYMEMLKLMGASPTPLDFTEIYSAMQQGMIDGGEGGLGTLWDIKFGEYAKYGVLTEQTRMVDLIVINEKALGKMSEEDAATVKRIMQATSDKSLEVIMADAQESMDLAEKNLGVKFVEIDKQPLIDSMKPIYERAFADPDKGPFLKEMFELQERSL